MSEAEIMKALECCKNDDCDHCQNNFGNCYANLAGFALDLINRKNAEIEKLCGEVDELIIAKDQLFDEAEALIKKARAEAIKEVLEKVAVQIRSQLGISTLEEKEKFYFCLDVIDQIAKEMGVEL